MIATFMPKTIAGYVWRFSWRHQIALAVLVAAIFGISVVPLEIQRRIVNTAIGSGSIESILWLAGAYVAVALVEHGAKFGLNCYRAWVSETSVLRLRRYVVGLVEGAAARHAPRQTGVEIAMVVSEAEPIGGFVGISASEPLLQIGILLNVLVYIIWLEPWAAVLGASFLVPQMIFVPLLQRSVNRRAQERITAFRIVSGDMVHDAHAVQPIEPLITRIFHLNMGIYVLKAVQKFLMNGTYHAAIGLALAVGGYLAITGRIELGSVVAIVSGLARLNEPWNDLLDWWRELAVVSVKYRFFAVTANRLVETHRGRSPLSTPAASFPQTAASN